MLLAIRRASARATSDDFRIMSALPPKADIARRQLDARFVPKADSCTAAINAVLRTGIA
jgi:hypothetical protein